MNDQEKYLFDLPTILMRWGRGDDSKAENFNCVLPEYQAD